MAVLRSTGASLAGDTEVSRLAAADKPPRVPARDLRKVPEDAMSEADSGGRDGAQGWSASLAVSWGTTS